MAFVMTKKRGTGVNLVHSLAIVRNRADGTMVMTESVLGHTREVTQELQGNPHWFIIINHMSIAKSATVRHVLQKEAAQLKAYLDDYEKMVRRPFPYTSCHSSIEHPPHTHTYTHIHSKVLLALTRSLAPPHPFRHRRLCRKSSTRLTSITPLSSTSRSTSRARHLANLLQNAVRYMIRSSIRAPNASHSQAPSSHVVSRR